MSKIEKGVFSLKKDFTTPTNSSMYGCKHCKENGIERIIEDEQRGVTDRKSQWGAGIPIEYRVCSGCSREDGGWVSASIVGGGW